MSTCERNLIDVTSFQYDKVCHAYYIGRKYMDVNNV